MIELKELIVWVCIVAAGNLVAMVFKEMIEDVIKASATHRAKRRFNKLVSKYCANKHTVNRTVDQLINEFNDQ